MDHPLSKRVETFTLGPGGTLPSGAQSRVIELGRPFPDSHEIRRIYLTIPNAIFTNAGGATTFEQTLAQRDAMWTALYSNIQLEVAGSAQPLQNYAAGEIAQVYRGWGYEGQILNALPAPGSAIDLSATPGVFNVGSLIFELPQVWDENPHVGSYTAPQAWTLKDGNGLRITAGSFSFSASGVTWVLDTSSPVDFEIWVEYRPNAILLAKPILGIRLDTVQQADGYLLPVFGPVAWCGVVNKAPSAWADTFDLTLAAQGGASCGGLQRSDWTHALRSHEYDRDMSRSPSYRFALGEPAQGDRLLAQQPTNLFWCRIQCGLSRLADIDGDLQIRQLSATDVATTPRFGTLSLIPVASRYQGGAVFPWPAQSGGAAIPPIFQAGAYVAHVMPGKN